jgi:hypothetical protein
VKITPDDEDRAVVLVRQDVEATIGRGQESAIRHEASMRRDFFNAPDVRDVSPDEYLEKVVEEIQQYLHDCFVDTTWPTCPFHARHPLWLRNGSWTCEQLNASVARLGELRASRDVAGQYLIVANRDHRPTG